MNEKILKTLYDLGPQTLDQLESETGATVDDLCDSISALICFRQVHLETDGTVWYAREVTA